MDETVNRCARMDERVNRCARMDDGGVGRLGVPQELGWEGSSIKGGPGTLVRWRTSSE